MVKAADKRETQGRPMSGDIQEVWRSADSGAYNWLRTVMVKVGDMLLWTIKKD